MKKVGCSASSILGIILSIILLYIVINHEDFTLLDDGFFKEKIGGHFMYSYPKKMKVDIPDNFKVLITRDSIRDIGDFTSKLSIHNAILIEKVRVGHIMEVDLIETDTTVRDLKINLLNSKEQILDKYSPAIWQWKVKPLNEGFHSLTVIAKIKIMTQNLKFVGYKDLPIIERTILVEANEPQISAVSCPGEEEKYERSYYWFALIPILGLMIWFSIIKKRKSKNQLIPVAEYEGFRTTYQDLIEGDSIEKSFELFENILIKYNYKNLKKDLVHLQSNYSNNESRYNKNLIDNEEFSINRSKVIDEILDLPSKLKVKEEDT